jgi:hypothetical protein
MFLSSSPDKDAGESGATDDFTWTTSFLLPDEASMSVDPGACVFQFVMVHPLFFNAPTAAASPAWPICAGVAILLFLSLCGSSR